MGLAVDQLVESTAYCGERVTATVVVMTAQSMRWSVGTAPGAGSPSAVTPVQVRAVKTPGAYLYADDSYVTITIAGQVFAPTLNESMAAQPTPPADNRPVHLLHRLARRLDEHFTAETRRRGLTPQLATALKFVEQELPMSELAKCLHCEPSNLTGIVDRLEDRGLAARVPDPTDRRIKRVVLSKAGRQTLHDLTEAFEEFEPIAGLSPADRSALIEILTRADHAANQLTEPRHGTDNTNDDQ